VNRFIDSTRIEQYDPVNTWLDKLPEWDGHDYIADLAARVPTDQPHWPEYLRMWLTGMVAQWRESDKQLTGNALVPLLIGKQGCGKTRFCKILMPPELRDYYNDKINFKNEFDLNIALTSFALINIDEFDKTTKGQQVVLKYLLSSADVKFRPPYGKTIKQYRRYTSFIGTTNQLQPLVDPTGSRRFVCVGIPAGKNIDFTDDLDHQQLYAQAQAELHEGARYWFDDAETAAIMEHNRQFQQQSSAEMFFHQYFSIPTSDGQEGVWMSAAEILLAIKKRAGAAFQVPAGNHFGRTLKGLPEIQHKHTNKGNVFYVLPSQNS
jgi:predicted P-loop ATPase